MHLGFWRKFFSYLLKFKDGNPIQAYFIPGKLS